MLIEGNAPRIEPDGPPLRNPRPTHVNGMVVFVDSHDARDGVLKPIIVEVALQRAVLCFDSPEDVLSALPELAGIVVCVVSARRHSAKISQAMRHELGQQFRSLPLVVLSQESNEIRSKAAEYGNTVFSDIHRLAAHILSLPSLPVIKSEATAGLFQGQLVDIQVGDESIRGTDWVFSDNRQFLLKGMHASRMPWYPRALGYDEHVSQVAAYMQGLQPVHRCSPGTFLAILREGGLMSRSELEALFESGGASKSHVMRISRHLRLQELTRKSRFAKVKRFVFKYAEAKCELASAEDDREKEKATAKVREFCPKGLSEDDMALLDSVVDEVIEDVQKASEGAVTGIGYSKDKALGTERHVFSTIGPNRGFHYGSVVIILSSDLLYHPDTWISPLAATGYMGPFYWVFRHRPWSGAALVALSRDEDKTDYTGIDDTPENEEKGIECCVKSSVNMAAVEGWSLIMAREVDAMCHYLSYDHREAYKFDDGTSGCAKHGLNWMDEDVRKSSASKLMDSKKQQLLPNAWQQVVSYYETKDSHTMYEAHLPPFVPLGAIEKICISSDLYEHHTDIREKVDKFVLPDDRRLKDLIVMTDEGEECMSWQHGWFEQRRQDCRRWQEDVFDARRERVHWENSASRASVAAERERYQKRPISVRMAGRAGRPCFLPPDIGYWGRRFKEHEYRWWKDRHGKDLRLSFASRAFHNVRVIFSSTTEPQRPEANLADEQWKSSLYQIALSVWDAKKGSSSSFITKGLRNTRHVVHSESDPLVQCTRSGDSMEDGIGVWERYWFSVVYKDVNGSTKATVACGKGHTGENVMMSYEDEEPLDGLKYIGLACWNEPTTFCDLRVEWPYD